MGVYFKWFPICLKSNGRFRIILDLTKPLFENLKKISQSVLYGGCSFKATCDLISLDEEELITLNNMEALLVRIGNTGASKPTSFVLNAIEASLNFIYKIINLNEPCAYEIEAIALGMDHKILNKVEEVWTCYDKIG